KPPILQTTEPLFKSKGIKSNRRPPPGKWRSDLHWQARHPNPCEHHSPGKKRPSPWGCSDCPEASSRCSPPLFPLELAVRTWCPEYNSPDRKILSLPPASTNPPAFIVPKLIMPVFIRRPT